MSDKRHTTLRPQGWLFGTFPDGRTVEFETVQCVHCGGAFVLQPGSGKIRGWCHNCNGFVCGPGCAACVPTEQLLENLEAGKPALHKPAIISTAGLSIPEG